MTKKPTIALVDEDVYGMFAFASTLSHFHGINAEHYYNAISALEGLVLKDSKKYPLILMEIDLSPGESYLKDAGLTEVVESLKEEYKKTNEIIRLPKGNKPPNKKIGLYVIQKIRANNSKNRNTPLFVFGEYNSETDERFPYAQKKVLEAGATKYFPGDSTEKKDLIRAIKRELKK